jgi:hypothetical protein
MGRLCRTQLHQLRRHARTEGGLTTEATAHLSTAKSSQEVIHKTAILLVPNTRKLFSRVLIAKDCVYANCLDNDVDLLTIYFWLLEIPKNAVEAHFADVSARAVSPPPSRISICAWWPDEGSARERERSDGDRSYAEVVRPLSAAEQLAAASLVPAHAQSAHP